MISTPKHMANRISKIGNTLKANNENDMALVKATQSSSSLEPYRHDTFINQQTQSNILEKTGAKIVQQVTTTTTTTTTTTIIKHQNDEDVRTPKKGITKELIFILPFLSVNKINIIKSTC